MEEYPIGRFYCDARALRLYGGTDEVMKTIIARSLIAGGT
jgi:acyl-CoA dehydrogenase